MKKVLIVVLIIILLLAATFATLYFIDMDRMKNNKPVVFSTWGYDYVPPLGGITLKPPKLTVHLLGSARKINAITGSYSWKENGQAIIADSIHPSEFEYKNENTIVYEDTPIVIDNTQFAITSIYLYKIGSYQIENVDITYDDKNIEIKNLQDGEYALEITLDYPHGTAHYGIKIIKNKSNEGKSFIGTILEETATYIIVEPNQDEEERNIANQIKVNFIPKENVKDYVYEIGRKVLIKYTQDIINGEINTNANNILVNGYADFTISVVESNDKKKRKILNNNDIYKMNPEYDLYYYGLKEVNVTIENKTMPLEQALKEGKVTLDAIIAKANNLEGENVEPISDSKQIPYILECNDGGTIEYHYLDYTIIKKHTLDGDRDVYIGTKDMSVNSL